MKLAWRDALKGARLSLADRLRRVAPSNWVALILFALLASIVIRLWTRVSLAPGQDYHFHLMAAAMHARPSGNVLRELFHPLHPLDANTLVYRLAWPFVRLFGPVRGFEITVGLLYYLGFPAAVWYALRRSGRAPWGALLAFVFVYCRAWSLDGFVPFLCSSTLMVLCLGEWDALLALRDAKLRWTVARAAVFSSLLFVCHAHTFGWIAATLGVITALSAIRRLVAGDSALPLRENAREAWRASLGSLLAILPALAMVYFWMQRVETYAPPLPPDPPSLVPPPTMELVMINRVQAFHIYFLQLVEPKEVKSAVALALLCVGLLFFAQRDNKRSLTFELFSLGSLASFFMLPNDIRGQSIAPRHLEFFAWSLPLVLWPAPDPARLTAGERQHWPWIREGLLLSFAIVFVVGRLRTIETAVTDLNRIELEPVLALVEPCRRAKSSSRAVLAYVPMDKESRYVRSWAMQQVHETLAAACEVDAPVYDSHRRFHHVVPLRYRGPLPAPLSLYEGAAYWYLPSSGLWDHYEFVLTQGWDPTPEAQVELDRVATLVGRSGAYRLYHRRAR